MNRRLQQGFTLIELVVVMVILGILAAVAVPQFVNLKTQARAASLNGLAGAINGAQSIVRGAYFALGTAPATVTLQNGNTVAVINTLNAKNEGLPDVTTGGIDKALSAQMTTTASNPTGGDYLWVQGTTGQKAYFTLNIAPFNATATDVAVQATNCYVSYDATNSATAGKVTVVTTSC